jgi:hypothetical protein
MSKGKGGKGAIFYGTCYNCGAIGHSSQRCPELGKGFKGNCHGCGTKGHTKAECPKGTPKGKGKGMNSVEGGGDKGGLNLGGGDEVEPEAAPSTASSQKAADYIQPQYGNAMYFPPEAWDWNGCYTLERAPEETKSTIGVLERVKEIEEGTRVKKTRFEKEGGWNEIGRKGKVIKDRNQVMAVNGTDTKKQESTWVKVTAVMDSGAVETMCGKGHLDEEDVTETKSSKKGMRYMAADGGYITNMGEGDVQGKSEEGIPLKLKAQVGDKITKMLIAVKRVCEGGNMVMFNVDQESLKELAKCENMDPNMIVNKKSGTKSKINEENGLYTYPIWTRRRVRNETEKKVNAIGKGEERTNEDYFEVF